MAGFKKGGSIVLSPFSAGEGVEATEELEVVAWRITKAIADQLAKNDTPFDVVTTKAEASVDFVLTGHIVKQEQDGVLKTLTFRSKTKSLGVVGRVIELQSGRELLTFEHSISSKKLQEDFKTLGQQIGRDIGQFIVESLNK